MSNAVRQTPLPNNLAGERLVPEFSSHIEALQAALNEIVTLHECVAELRGRLDAHRYATDLLLHGLDQADVIDRSAVNQGLQMTADLLANFETSDPTLLHMNKHGADEISKLIKMADTPPGKPAFTIVPGGKV